MDETDRTDQILATIDLTSIPMNMSNSSNSSLTNLTAFQMFPSKTMEPQPSTSKDNQTYMTMTTPLQQNQSTDNHYSEVIYNNQEQLIQEMIQQEMEEGRHKHSQDKDLFRKLKQSLQKTDLYTTSLTHAQLTHLITLFRQLEN